MALAKLENEEQAKGCLRVTKVSTPQWGDLGDRDPHVFVRILSADQAGAVEELATASREPDDDKPEGWLHAKWCILGLCDAEGETLYTDDDVPTLLAGPLIPLQMCAVKIMQVNGVGGFNVEELEKNFGNPQAGEPPSD